jgi:geranylgeranyl diphosphate synthase type I
LIPTYDNLRRELLPGVNLTQADALESATRSFIDSRNLDLYRMMSFQMGWIDENGDRSIVPTRTRLHGQFALAVAGALSADGSDVTGSVVPYAIALELLHNFALIHEDVEDGNTERNGRPSVWWTWGPAQAINAGDGMHAMARMAVFAVSEQGGSAAQVTAALKALDHAAMLYCEGEYADITMQEQLALSTEKYLDMARMRSGSLFGACAQISAIATGHAELSTQLFTFGQAAGAARQVAEDYMLFWGDEQLDPVQQGRLLTKKKNLAVVHTFESGTPGTKRQLGEIYAQRVIDPAKLDVVKDLLNGSGAREYTIEVLNRLVNQASGALETEKLNAGVREKLDAAVRGLVGLADKEV